MFGNNFKIFVRNLLKQKSFTIINVLGLSIAITSAVLIFLYVYTELSFDNFHNSENVYRISYTGEREGKLAAKEDHIFVSSAGPDLRAEMPEVVDYTRHTTKKLAYAQINGKNLKINNLIYADSTFFNFFGFEFISEQKSKILVNPYELILTETFAKKLFGKSDVVGKSLELNGESFSISAVVKDAPVNSHITFEAIASFETLLLDKNLYFGWNGGNQFISYVRFAQNTSPSDIEVKLKNFLDKHINGWLKPYNIKISLFFRPLNELHLNHNEYSESLKQNLIVFSLIAFLIILIAAINFVNLSTAKAGRRIKEIGVKKVLGVKNSVLVKQFIGESVFISLISGIVSIILIEILLSPFYTFLGKKLLLENVFDPVFLLSVILFSGLIGILSGIYPAFYMLKFNPSGILNLRFGKSKERFRNVLAGFQFFITVMLISFVIVLGKQIDYLKGKNLGFDKENLASIEVAKKLNADETEILKNSYANLPGVSGVTGSSEIPVYGFASNGYFPEGFNSPVILHILKADDKFLEAYNIKLKKGRKLNKLIKSDDTKILVNESLVKMFHWQTNPIGKTIRRNNVNYEIVGVVEDFNFASLHHKIKPLIIGFEKNHKFITLKLAGTGIMQTIEDLKEKWNEFDKGIEFEISFLDELLDRQYKREEQFNILINIFSFISIVLAVLGLFSLASFTAELRSKEICIRKVLGAGLRKLLLNLSMEYLLLAGIASVIAIPVAYFLIQMWLEGFSYSINVSGMEFILAIFFSILIVVISIGSQIVKTALMNPVDSLRNE